MARKLGIDLEDDDLKGVNRQPSAATPKPTAGQRFKAVGKRIVGQEGPAPQAIKNGARKQKRLDKAATSPPQRGSDTTTRTGGGKRGATLRNPGLRVEYDADTQRGLVNRIEAVQKTREIPFTNEPVGSTRPAPLESVDLKSQAKARAPKFGKAFEMEDLRGRIAKAQSQIHGLPENSNVRANIQSDIDGMKKQFDALQTEKFRVENPAAKDTSQLGRQRARIEADSAAAKASLKEQASARGTHLYNDTTAPAQVREPANRLRAAATNARNKVGDAVDTVKEGANKVTETVKQTVKNQEGPVNRFYQSAKNKAKGLFSGGDKPASSRITGDVEAPAASKAVGASGGGKVKTPNAGRARAFLNRAKSVPGNAVRRIGGGAAKVAGPLTIGLTAYDTTTNIMNEEELRKHGRYTRIDQAPADTGSFTNKLMYGLDKANKASAELGAGFINMPNDIYRALSGKDIPGYPDGDLLMGLTSTQAVNSSRYQEEVRRAYLHGAQQARESGVTDPAMIREAGNAAQAKFTSAVKNETPKSTPEQIAEYADPGGKFRGATAAMRDQRLAAEDRMEKLRANGYGRDLSAPVQGRESADSLFYKVGNAYNVRNDQDPVANNLLARSSLGLRNGYGDVSNILQSRHGPSDAFKKASLVDNRDGTESLLLNGGSITAKRGSLRPGAGTTSVIGSSSESIARQNRMMDAIRRNDWKTVDQLANGITEDPVSAKDQNYISQIQSRNLEDQRKQRSEIEGLYKSLEENPKSTMNRLSGVVNSSNILNNNIADSVVARDTIHGEIDRVLSLDDGPLGLMGLLRSFIPTWIGGSGATPDEWWENTFGSPMPTGSQGVDFASPEFRRVFGTLQVDKNGELFLPNLPTYTIPISKMAPEIQGLVFEYVGALNRLSQSP